MVRMGLCTMKAYYHAVHLSKHVTRQFIEQQFIERQFIEL